MKFNPGCIWGDILLIVMILYVATSSIKVKFYLIITGVVLVLILGILLIISDLTDKH